MVGIGRCNQHRLRQSPSIPLRITVLPGQMTLGVFPLPLTLKAILERLAIQLEGTGCRVERCSPPGFDFATALQTYDEIVDTELGVLEPSLRTLILHLLGPVSGLLPGSLA